MKTTKLNNLYSSIKTNTLMIGRMDLNIHREEILELLKDINKDSQELINGLESNKNDKIKATYECLNCNKYGLEYETDVHVNQNVKCEYCRTEHKVKLYKNGRIRVQQK